MPATTLRALYALSCLILLKPISPSHFIDEETEIQRGLKDGKWHNQKSS